MKKLLLLLFPAFVFIACKKNNDSGCKVVPPAEESEQMAAFCMSKGIGYTVDANGIYYQIIDQGTGMRPDENSTVTVTYTTSTLDGNVIEDKSNPPVMLPLNQFIEGWRLALPYIQKGGRIKMVIPSSLAYGCTGANTVAPNTPLYYDVVLINVE